MTYGSEAWLLDEEACKAINRSNAIMLAFITGKTIAEEANIDTTTFNVVMWIRCRRLQWCGHILRMQDERMVKWSLFHIYENRQLGDMLMDIPPGLSWTQLQKMAADRLGWKKRVQKLKDKVQLRQTINVSGSITKDTIETAAKSMGKESVSRAVRSQTRSQTKKTAAHSNPTIDSLFDRSMPTRTRSTNSLKSNTQTRQTRKY